MVHRGLRHRENRPEKEYKMKISRKGLLIGALVAAGAGTVLAGQAAKPASTDTMSVPEVQCVIGLEGYKPNSKGTLIADASGLRFEKEKQKSAIPMASLTDIFLGNESRQDISGMGGTAIKAAIPYGGGRLLSLFSHKVEVLTVEFTDSNGAFHGAIFVLPEGHATQMKAFLVDHGAKTTTHVPEPEAPKEQKEKP